MPSTGYILSALAVFLVVTFALRALPFLLVERLRESRAVSYLGTHLPVGIMVILVVYTLRETRFTVAPYGAAELGALALTIGLHLWRRSALLSILAGTLSYVGLLAVLT